MIYGKSTLLIVKIFGASVHTNIEALLILLATAFLCEFIFEQFVFVTSFAVGTGLHLACHWLVAVAYGKGIDRMILTRSGRIDYSGLPATLKEELARISAGPLMNFFVRLWAILSFGSQ